MKPCRAPSGFFGPALSTAASGAFGATGADDRFAVAGAAAATAFNGLLLTAGVWALAAAARRAATIWAAAAIFDFVDGADLAPTGFTAAFGLVSCARLFSPAGVAVGFDVFAPTAVLVLATAFTLLALFAAATATLPLVVVLLVADLALFGATVFFTAVFFAAAGLVRVELD